MKFVFGALLLFSPGIWAGANVFCVLNEAQLTAAISAAQGNALDDEIRLQAGFYTGEFNYSSAEGRDISFTGGWDSGCVSQANDPTLTVLDGMMVQRPLRVSLGSTAANAAVRMMTVRNGNSTGAGNRSGGGVRVSGTVGSTGTIDISHVIFFGNQCDDFGGGLSASSDGGQVLLSNNLFVNNHALINHGGASLTSNNAQVLLVNNTVADNTVATMGTPAGGLSVGGSSVAHISNNIFWGNQGADLRVVTTTNVTINNTVEELLGTLGTGSMNLSMLNPEFVGSGDYHVQFSSPVIDAGINDPVGGLSAFDLEGSIRLQGAFADQGAYEISDVTFADGLEGP